MSKPPPPPSETPAVNLPALLAGVLLLLVGGIAWVAMSRPSGPAAPKAAATPVTADPEANAGGKPIPIRIETSLGDISAELYPGKAPITVANFLNYINAKHYDGTIFHRVIEGFMIQGGGHTPDLVEKPTGGPIKNESGNGLKNRRGWLAMARTNHPDSATVQFYINTVDNPGLDSGRYAVFGMVTSGIDVVDAIRAVRTGFGSNGQPDVPVTPVVIKSVRRTDQTGN